MSEKKQKGRTRRLKEADFKRDEDGKITAKRCLGECGEILELKAFAAAKRNKRDGTQCECRNCKRKISQQAYQHKTEYLEFEKKQVGGCENKCVFQNATDWKVLEFSHFDRDKKAVKGNGSKKPFTHLPLAKMKIERKKGRFLCCNCHRLETKQENENLSLNVKYSKSGRKTKQQRERLRTFVNEEKLKRKACLHCSETVTQNNFCIFDFDHLNRAEKVDKISEMVARLRPISEIEAEMKKCQLLCGNCHRLKTLTESDHVPVNSKKRKTPPSTKTEDPVLKKQKMDLQKQLNAEWIEMSF